jgi:hypothetical protein
MPFDNLSISDFRGELYSKSTSGNAQHNRAGRSPFDVASGYVGSGTFADTGRTVISTASKQLLFGAIGVEGPNTDLSGTWLDHYLDDFSNPTGTAGGSATSNITLHVSFRLTTATGRYRARKQALSNRAWAGAVASYKTENQ